MDQRIYGYYCPVAHALGAIGERWSLLIIRDLMKEPKRFTDLANRLGNITPKWLTLRLRQLEDAGIVQRMKGRDRRETWYQLTSAGQELRPVIETLRQWGLRHAMRSPLPGEVVHPDLAIGTLAESLNGRDKKLSHPRSWLFKFTDGTPHTLSYNGENWLSTEEEAVTPDVVLEISPSAWATFLTVSRDQRKRLADSFHISGAPESVGEFLNTFGVR